MFVYLFYNSTGRIYEQKWKERMYKSNDSKE